MPIDVEDYEAFMGFNILMGIIKEPSLSSYCKRDPVYHYAPIADRISRDRFREISRYLHYVDNSTLSLPGSPSYDRLGKVQPLLEYLQSKFKAVYNPGERLAVDEAIIKFHSTEAVHAQEAD